MHWISRFLTSTLGKKLIMSLTGLFLILFLIVHLSGNLQLLKADQGEAFNKYAYFMTHNPFILVISYSLYFFIILHSIQGILLAIKNRAARKTGYRIGTYPKATWAAKQMALLGVLIFAFLLLHMGDFWFKMKRQVLPEVTYADMSYPVQNLYYSVEMSFAEWWIVLAYLIGLLALAFHLYHGFQSAFQTLGLNHKKYTPAIRLIGTAYSILIPAAFAILPIYFYLFRS